MNNKNLGHRSDCAIFNEPAYRDKPCDCGFEDKQNREIEKLKEYISNLQKKLDEICKITDY